MIKTTCNLTPGDVVWIRGRRAHIEMTSKVSDGYIIRHTLGESFYRANAQWLIEEPLDNIVRMAEEIANRGRNKK